MIQRWRGELQTRQDNQLADAFFSACIFARWRYRTEQEQRLSGQITVWEGTQRRRDTIAVFEHWQRAAQLQQVERIVAAKRDCRVGGQVLMEWASRAKQQQTAGITDRRRVLTLALTSWKSRHHRLQVCYSSKVPCYQSHFRYG